MVWSQGSTGLGGPSSGLSEGDVTPALMAFVASPIDSTRVVTVALLDLLLQGRIAFFDDPPGRRAGIRVTAVAAASSRLPGPAELALLQGLKSQAGEAGTIARAEFGQLRSLFEQTAERLERMSRAPTAEGHALRTTLSSRRWKVSSTLTGRPERLPAWITDEADAALWGYALCLDRDVRAFAERKLSTTGLKNGAAGAESMALFYSLTRPKASRTVGIDTDAIASRLCG